MEDNSDKDCQIENAKPFSQKKKIQNTKRLTTDLLDLVGDDIRKLTKNRIL